MDSFACQGVQAVSQVGRCKTDKSEASREWRIFSAHGMVLFYIAANADSTLRQVSDALGITERHVARIVRDLADVDMLRIRHVGRRNSYEVNPEARLRHPTLSHVPLEGIIDAVAPALERDLSST